MKCEHDIITIFTDEEWKPSDIEYGQPCINTMDDYVPVKYCPLCGEKLI